MAPRRNRYVFSYAKKRRAQTIKRIIAIIGGVVVVAVALLFVVGLLTSGMRINLVEDTTVEVNTTAKASQFIANLDGGTLVEDPEVDTSSVGNKVCIVKVKKGNEIEDYSFTVKVIDTEAPELTVGGDGINILLGTDYDVMTRITATDNSNEEIEVLVEGSIDPNTEGAQTVKLVASDSSKNTTEKEVTVNVVVPKENMEDMTILTSTGHTGEIRGGVFYVDDVLVVNKSFSLPADFAPGLQEEATNAYYAMVAEAEKEDLEFDIITGFRDYYEQEMTYSYYIEILGEDPATTSGIKAGHSEHQSGLAMDLNYTYEDFAYTAECQWLNANCANYGFIIRYPENKEGSTGCAWEPWHIRYVGEELATKLYNGGDWITLEEYFGLPSRYPEA